MARPNPTTIAERAERLRLPQLEQALLTTDPAAVLTPPRILRRVIKQVAEIGGIGLHMPHRKTFVVSRARLLTFVDPAELDLEPGVELLDTVILLAHSPRPSR